MLGFYQVLIDYAWMSILNTFYELILSIEIMYILSYETMNYYELLWCISTLHQGFTTVLVGLFA